MAETSLYALSHLKVRFLLPTTLLDGSDPFAQLVEKFHALRNQKFQCGFHKSPSRVFVLNDTNLVHIF